MARITFFLGLAGSGKSYEAEKLCAETGAKYFEGILAQEHASRLAEMLQHLDAGVNCVVEEIAFCRSDIRNQFVAFVQARVQHAEFEWVCFENNLESANWNVQNRANKGAVPGHLSINQQYHSLYTYPEGARVIPIVRTIERQSA